MHLSLCVTTFFVSLLQERDEGREKTRRGEKTMMRQATLERYAESLQTPRLRDKY